jgi:hypothetical protein
VNSPPVSLLGLPHASHGKCRCWAKHGTMKLSHLSHLCLEDAELLASFTFPPSSDDFSLYNPLGVFILDSRLLFAFSSSSIKR